MASILSPLRTAQPSSTPPADKSTTTPRRLSLSQNLTSRPSYDKLPRRASIRYSLSSDSSTSPVSTASPTSPDASTPPSRRFKLPVRVSTEQTSFGPSESSPESRRRSVSVASDSKRRSRSLYLQQLEEDKIADGKASPTPKSPPPPAYEKTTAVSDNKKASTPKADGKKVSSPSKVQEPSPPAYDKPATPPTAKEKEPTRAPPAPAAAAAADHQKMSSAASTPEAQKGAMTGNPGVGNRGIDFSLGNGNTKLTAQSGNGLPLPGLSGKGNGPVGNLLRGPVDDEGNLKAAALTVGIKLDLEAEVHLSARVRGDILVGLY